jgi:inosine/xanthosine triphosphate pyrophosphatase family protein
LGREGLRVIETLQKMITIATNNKQKIEELQKIDKEVYEISKPLQTSEGYRLINLFKRSRELSSEISSNAIVVMTKDK